MSPLCSKRAAEKLTTSDIAVLDLLLEAYPEYSMVDDFKAVTRLLDRDYIEADVRKDGDTDQAIYRLTARGAEAYRLCNHVSVLERVG